MKTCLLLLPEPPLTVIPSVLPKIAPIPLARVHANWVADLAFEQILDGLAGDARQDQPELVHR